MRVTRELDKNQYTYKITYHLIDNEKELSRKERNRLINKIYIQTAGNIHYFLDDEDIKDIKTVYLFYYFFKHMTELPKVEKYIGHKYKNTDDKIKKTLDILEANTEIDNILNLTIKTPFKELSIGSMITKKDAFLFRISDKYYYYKENKVECFKKYISEECVLKENIRNKILEQTIYSYPDLTYFANRVYFGLPYQIALEQVAPIKDKVKFYSSSITDIYPREPKYNDLKIMFKVSIGHDLQFFYKVFNMKQDELYSNLQKQKTYMLEVEKRISEKLSNKIKEMLA